MIPDPIQSTLRSLRRRVPPAELRTRLRVMASRERQRRLSSGAWHDRSLLFFDNVVKVFAVPAAGGVFAAVLLFIMFVVPAYPLRGVTGMDSKQPSVKIHEWNLALEKQIDASTVIRVTHKGKHGA